MAAQYIQDTSSITIDDGLIPPLTLASSLLIHPLFSVVFSLPTPPQAIPRPRFHDATADARVFSVRLISHCTSAWIALHRPNRTPPPKAPPPLLTDSLSIIAAPLVLFSHLSVPPTMQLGFPHPPAEAALVQSLALSLSLPLSLGPLSLDSAFSIC